VYVNPHFVEADLGVLHAVIEDHPFGLLIAPGRPPSAAHIPFVLHRGEGELGTLVAHTARADPLAAALDGGTELLAVFEGPSAYVRSRWYVNPGLPTYNYIAVHAYGTATPLSGREAVLAHLSELVHEHEAGYDDEFRLSEADTEYLAPLLDHISPFSLEIKRIEGKVKLSQNRAADDRLAVISALRERGGDSDRALAEAMEGYPYRSDRAQPLIGARPITEDGNRDDSGTEPVNTLPSSHGSPRRGHP
jgi:transcriptional regulator